ncbi:MAG: FAD binding domain-containing protein [Paracoccaceae bacterium]
MSYTDAAPVMLRAFPHLEEYWSRIAGWQVRNAGTVGGNIANGSPIGDTPPC